MKQKPKDPVQRESAAIELIAKTHRTECEHVAAQVIFNLTEGSSVLTDALYIKAIQTLLRDNPDSDGWGLATCKFVVDELINDGVVSRNAA